MRLVWVVIPLVLFGIIGMQESFASAQKDSSEMEKLEEAHYVISQLFGPINFDLDDKCQKWGTTRALFDFRTSAIFYGKVTNITESSVPNEKIVTLNVDKSWYGVLSDSVIVTTNTERCGMAFIADNEYLVFATNDEPNFAATYERVESHISEYNIEFSIGSIENFVEDGDFEKFNQHRAKIVEAYDAITEWENQNNATIKFNFSNVVEQKNVLDVGLAVEGNTEISKEDLELLFEEIFGDINIRLLDGTTLVRENQNTSDITIMPPLKQTKHGIDPIGVTCRDGLQLIFKSSDDSPACVKPPTAEKLIQRGWALDENNTQNLFEVKVTQIINGTTITKSYYFATQEEADYFEQIGKGNKSKLRPEGYIPYKTPKISPELQEVLDSGVDRVDIAIKLKNTPKPPPDFLEMTDEEQVANLQERYAQIRMMQQDLVDYITNNDGIVIKQLEFINSVYADVPVTIIDELKNRDDIRGMGYYDKDAKAISMPIHPPG